MSTYEKVGIIPAGGKAVRFGGVRKELLPIGKALNPLTRSIMAMLLAGAEKVFIGASPRNYNRVLQATKDIPEAVVMGYPFWGMEEVIFQAVKLLTSNWYLFAMSDTVYPLQAFQGKCKADSGTQVGVFETMTPERFGCFSDGVIYDKDSTIKAPAKAWGVWVFDWAAAQSLEMLLSGGQLFSYTELFNYVYRNYPVTCFDLKYYFDLASFADYLEMLQKWKDEYGTES